MKNSSTTTKVLKAILALTAACLLLAALGSGIVLAAPDASVDPIKVKQFPDVPKSHWASTFITRLTNEGAINGYPDGTFGPERSITRAEFVTVTVGALLGKTDTPPANQHWATNIMKKAENNSLLEAGEFVADTWNTPINRQEMAKIMARASQFVQKEALVTNTGTYTSKITDFAGIPESYRSYIAQVYAKGIVTGYPDGSFGGERQATRAEASTMLVRLLDPAFRLCEIAFDPKTDVAADGRMKLAKAEQYMMKNLQSLRFYKEGGKFCFEGNLVEVPQGFENWLQIEISFNKPRKNGYYVYIYCTQVIGIGTDLPKEGPFKFEVPDLTNVNDVEYVFVQMSVRALEANPTTSHRMYEGWWQFSTGHNNRIALIDDTKHQIIINGKNVVVTIKEYNLLRLLCANPNTVMNREEIFDKIWGSDYIGESRTLDMHINSLRKKLEASETKIETLRSVGYLIK